MRRYLRYYFVHNLQNVTLFKDHIRQFDDNAWNNWKEILNKNSQQFWIDVKDKFISAEFQYAINVIENIMGNYTKLLEILLLVLIFLNQAVIKLYLNTVFNIT